VEIIGKARRGFILEADEDEVYNLIGYYSKYSDKAPRLEVGDTINVSDMYNQLYNLKSAERCLASTAKELRSIADYLEVVKPVTTANASDKQEE